MPPKHTMTYHRYSRLRPLVVGGHRLLPLQAGHLLVLDSLDSPFVRADVRRDPTPVDVSTAVWVCSCDWRFAASRIDHLWTKWIVARRSLLIRARIDDWTVVLRGYIKGALAPFDPLEFVRSGSSPPMVRLRCSARDLLGLQEEAFLASPVAAVIQDVDATIADRRVKPVPGEAYSWGHSSQPFPALTHATLARLEGAPRG